MTESITVSAILPATPQHIYDAWLSSDGHSDMTGAHANYPPWRWGDIHGMGRVY